MSCHLCWPPSAMAPRQPPAIGPEMEDAMQMRAVSTFSWDRVDPTVIRALLTADGAVPPIADARLSAAAAQRFGRAGGRKKLDPLAGTLRDVWLPRASANEVKE